ncbi:MAG: hypothetical protein MJ060_04580 [Clostridia bacterium]|nr:hypothetical protein [Clostridia bacterium]
MEIINTNKLLQLYKQPFAPTLSEGKYEVTLKSHELVNSTRIINGKPQDNSYVKFVFETTGDKPRRIVENRFEKGFAIAVSHIRQQLGKENEEVIPFEMFDELITNKTPLNLWVAKAQLPDGTTKTNIHFLEPLKKEETPAQNPQIVDEGI